MRNNNSIVWNEKKSVYETKILESHVETEIIQRLSYAHFAVFKVRENLPTGYRMSDPGIPDLHGRIPVSNLSNFSGQNFAIPFYIEVKKPGEMEKFRVGKLPAKRMRTIKAQQEFLAKAKLDGCIAGFAESWEEVRQLFVKHGITLP